MARVASEALPVARRDERERAARESEIIFFFLFLFEK